MIHYTEKGGEGGGGRGDWSDLTVRNARGLIKQRVGGPGRNKGSRLHCIALHKY